MNTYRPLDTFDLKREIRRKLQRHFATPYFLAQYRRSSSKIQSTRRSELFTQFLAGTDGPCLQIAVKDEIGRKFGPNWTSVDKYDHSTVIDRHDDVQQLEFPDASFDAVACWSVLEHVPNPAQALMELHRVLRPGGKIWVQLPFLFPYHGHPNDYWRVTPNGLRQWMKNFNEIHCGCDYWSRTKIVAATFYYGTKP